ncbi:MAG: RNA polymerase sigma factor [Ignavibacteriae bacterium]|nr:MAG: RNA polymerase sigma factor [Ignavibacteriota bacterium]
MEAEIQAAAQYLLDEQIIERVIGGEQSAYELIMRKYNKKLYRIVRAYISDEDEIEDIIQEAYIKAYEQLPRFEKRSSFSTWLIRIAINGALARLKIKKRFSPIAYDQQNDEGSVLERQIAGPDKETPVDKLMNSELKDILEKAADRLPENYRTVFLMREVEEMSVAETGTFLDLTESNVKVRLNRAKEMLRESIGSVYRSEEIFEFDLTRCDRIVRNVLNRLRHGNNNIYSQ